MVDVARTQFPDDVTQATGLGIASVEPVLTDAIERLKDYARDEPITFALWAFGIGFVLGWRLKPW